MNGGYTMNKMKDMNISEFPKAQKKLIRKIAVMAPANLIKEILHFYKCPPECGASCCKVWDIPLIMDDKARISRKGQGYRKIIKEQTKIQQSMLDGITITEEVFSTKPCPFLHKDRCSIHKISPLLCSLYPFKASKKSKSLIEIVACSLGADLLTDLAAFELYMAMVNKDAQTKTPVKLDEGVQRIQDMDKAGTDDLEKTLVYSIYDIETLRFFLLYLNNEGMEAVISKRTYLQSIARAGC
jgi:Fe-S-cluster containining protein